MVRIWLFRVCAVSLVAFVVLLGFSSCSRSKKVLGAHGTEWKQQDLFITYCCSAPPTENVIKQSLSESFNMVPAWQETLDIAAKNKQKILLEHGLLTPGIANDPAKLHELEQLGVPVIFGAQIIFCEKSVRRSIQNPMPFHCRVWQTSNISVGAIGTCTNPSCSAHSS